MQRDLAAGVGFLIGLILLCDLAVVGVHLLDDHTALISDRRAAGTTRTTDVAVVPGPGQAFVTGALEKVSADNAQVPPLTTPFTITAVERGVGRLSIEKALMAGRRTTITWDGGTPLPVSGTGGLDLGALHVEVDAKGPVFFLDGSARTFSAGTYTLGATVAVGTAGLSTPREGVVFTADNQTVLTTRGNVVVHRDPQKLDLLGPGKLSLAGQLKVQFPDGTKNAATVTFAGGPYRVTVDPAGDTLKVDAILQGEVGTG